MEALILLVPLSLAAVGVAVAFFFRMNASGQFDDDVGPAWSVLMDDDRAPAPTALSTQEAQEAQEAWEPREPQEVEDSRRD